MGRFVLPTALLLGLLGAAGAQRMAPSGARPEYPADPAAGCTPGQLTADECPARMECFADKNFPLGGRCDCNPLWFKYAGKLPFDDSEWDDGFTTDDCVNHHVSRFILGAMNLAGAVVTAALTYTAFVVIRELHRVKALRRNATTYSLFFLLWSGTGIFIYFLIYMFNTWDADKTEYWYFSRGVAFTYLIRPPTAVIDFEVAVTWVDLYDRTSKMSKSSSRAVKGIRYFLRTLSLIDSIGFGIWMSMTNSVLSVLVGYMSPMVFGILTNLIGGTLIGKTLCPDKKDVANPNWKVAEAIRRAVKHSVGAKVLEFVAMVGLLATGKHPQLGYMYSSFAFLFAFGFILGKAAWLQYLIYGSRKHLKRFASEASSAYFGFSTIGLNKTLTHASSKLNSSKMSSVVSKRSSAVSSAPVAESSAPAE